MRTMPGGEDPGIPGMTFTVVEKDGEWGMEPYEPKKKQTNKQKERKML